MMESPASAASDRDLVPIGRSISRIDKAPRWNEVTIYRLSSGGGYVVRSVGRSIFPGEETRVMETRCLDAVDVRAALIRGPGRQLTHVAQRAIAAAVAADAAFARDYARVLAGERVGPPQPGSSRFVLPLLGRSPFRFNGRVLSSNLTRDRTIYALDDGGYLLARLQMPQGYIAPTFAKTARDLLRAALSGGGAWLTEPTKALLDRAAMADPAFAANLGRWHCRAYARIVARVTDRPAPLEFGGILICEVGATKIYRVADPYIEEKYLWLSRVASARTERYDRWACSLANLVATASPEVLRECALHDRDVAHAIGLALAPATDAEAAGAMEDFAATRPREALRGLPPPWDLA